jgi:predicted PurR-regulated permease PerM
VGSAARDTTSSTVALWILATIAVVFFLRAAAQLLIPIVIAVLISYVLEPLVIWLARHRVPRLAGTSLLLLTILGLATWGGYSLRDDAMQAVESLPQAARRVRDMMMSQSQNGPAASLQQAADELRGTAGDARGADVPAQAAGTSGQQEQRDNAPRGGGEAEARDRTQGSPQATPLGGVSENLSSLVQRGVGSVFALAGHVTVVFFLVFFLLLSGRHVKARLVEIAGPDAEWRRTAATIVDDINAQIQRFLLVRLVTAAVVGVLTWLALVWIGVEQAPLWGLLAGVFNSIPYFGPVIVSGGLLVVGLLQGGGTTQALQMAGAALAITSLEGWLLTPPLMGKAERMSVLAVFLGLLLWTWIWGAWGTILAVPMLVMVKSVADHVPRLRPLGRLMAP